MTDNEGPVAPEAARSTERAARAFADFYKSERARCELCLETILSILCDTSEDADKIDKTLECLEAHWGRYETMRRQTWASGTAETATTAARL